MNEQSTDIRGTAVSNQPVCSCCAPARPLLPEGNGQPARWATCAATSLLHENRGDGIFLLAARPRQSATRAEDQWAGGGSAPSLAPGVRIDLSRESYA